MFDIREERTVNTQLERLAAEVALSDGSMEHKRLAFACACVDRIAHLLEEPEVLDCLAVLHGYLGGTSDQPALSQARVEAARLANQHRGSKSIDGCGHAAVSATYAVANALAGKALEAASYAAYASVYVAGGYAAVADRDAFAQEFAWQVETLRRLCEEASV